MVGIVLGSVGGGDDGWVVYREDDGGVGGRWDVEEEARDEDEGV